VEGFIITFCPRSKRYKLYFANAGEVHFWYMPKEPPQETNLRRMAHTLDRFAPAKGDDLAMTVADHQIDDPGEVWDEGGAEMDSWNDAKIVMHLAGRKLSGKYVLLNVGERYGEGSWLIFRAE